MSSFMLLLSKIKMEKSISYIWGNFITNHNSYLFFVMTFVFKRNTVHVHFKLGLQLCKVVFG